MSDVPLRRHLAFASDDLTSFRAYLSGSYCDHRIFSRDRKGAIHALYNRVVLGSMSLNYLRYGVEVDIDPGPLETFYLLEMPDRGETMLTHGGETLTNRPGTAILVSPSRSTRSVWSPDCGQRMIKISRAAVERQAGELLGRTLREPLVFKPFVDLASEPGASIARMTNFLFDQYEYEAGILTERRVSAELERSLIAVLLLSQPSNYSEALHRRRNDVCPGTIRRAITFVDEHIDGDIDLDDLVRVSGVSARTLYNGFSRFVSQSPLGYIRNQRLERARQDLVNAAAGDTVVGIASRWNISHMGRFSAEYRARYGELPSQTLARAR